MVPCCLYITSAIGVPTAFLLREANITGLTRAKDTTACAGGAPLVVRMTTTFQ